MKPNDMVFDTTMKNPKGFIFNKSDVEDPSIFKAKLYKRNYKTKEKIVGIMKFETDGFYTRSSLEPGSTVNVFKTPDGKYFAYTIWNLKPNSNGSKVPRHFISKLFVASKDNISLRSIIPKPKYTFEDLQDLLSKHDWSYEMSDDSRVWNKGKSQQKQIKSVIEYILKNSVASLEDVKIELNKYTNKKSVGQYPPEAYLPRGYK